MREVRGGDHLGGQPGLARLAQGPRIDMQLGAGRTEHIGRRGQVSPSQRSEVSGDSVQRPCLAMGQAEHLDPGARKDERVQDRAETERLVVRMGDHRQNRRPGRRDTGALFGRVTSLLMLGSSIDGGLMSSQSGADGSSRCDQFHPYTCGAFRTGRAIGPDNR